MPTITHLDPAQQTEARQIRDLLLAARDLAGDFDGASAGAEVLPTWLALRTLAAVALRGAQLAAPRPTPTADDLALAEQPAEIDRMLAEARALDARMVAAGEVWAAADDRALAEQSLPFLASEPGPSIPDDGTVEDCPACDDPTNVFRFWRSAHSGRCYDLLGGHAIGACQHCGFDLTPHLSNGSPLPEQPTPAPAAPDRDPITADAEALIDCLTDQIADYTARAAALEGRGQDAAVWRARARAGRPTTVPAICAGCNRPIADCACGIRR